MIIYPTIFGIIQFWIVDNFLKKKVVLDNKESDIKEKNKTDKDINTDNIEEIKGNENTNFTDLAIDEINNNNNYNNNQIDIKEESISFLNKKN